MQKNYLFNNVFNDIYKKKLFLTFKWNERAQFLGWGVVYLIVDRREVGGKLTLEGHMACIMVIILMI